MRTVKNVDKVLILLTQNPSLLADAVEFMMSDEKIIAMRAADCVEKFSRIHPELCQPYTQKFMNLLEATSQQEVQWHLALILPQLDLSSADIQRALPVWEENFYHHSSSIVRTASLQAIRDVAKRNTDAAKLFETMLPYAIEHGTPAMQARARHFI